MRAFDFIVVGAGTAGSATCKELAERGHAVLGLDAFRPPHDLGSHHGESRSIRRAYLEGTSYVPMAMRSWDLWCKLERDAKTTLLVPTGNLTIGPPDCPAVTGFLASATRYDIPHRELTAADVAKRWPQLAVPGTFVAGLEVEAGLLFPEACISLLLSAAQKAGASMRFNERVMAWSVAGDRVSVTTQRGQYEAGRLLLAAGARNKTLLGRTGATLHPKRVPVAWIDPPAGAPFELGAVPVNFWQLPAAGVVGSSPYHEFYALPVTRSRGRVKVGAHNCLDGCDPDDLERTVTAREAQRISDFVRLYLPSLENRDTVSHVCLYTLTPDGEFSLGPLPGSETVFLAALAGHGFKFAPVLGEILADLLEGNTPAYDISLFSPDRWD